jgi:hypothetical protein
MQMSTDAGSSLRSTTHRRAWSIGICVLILCSSLAAQVGSTAAIQAEVNDVHFHLTNYIQEGTDIHKFLDIMGTKVGRVAIFGIPLQQQWSYRNDGDRAPRIAFVNA